MADNESRSSSNNRNRSPEANSEGEAGSDGSDRFDDLYPLPRGTVGWPHNWNFIVYDETLTGCQPWIPDYIITPPLLISLAEEFMEDRCNNIREEEEVIQGGMTNSLRNLVSVIQVLAQIIVSGRERWWLDPELQRDFQSAVFLLGVVQRDQAVPPVAARRVGAVITRLALFGPDLSYGDREHA